MRQQQRDILRRHGLASSGALLFTLLFLAGFKLQGNPADALLLYSVMGVYWAGQAALLYWVGSGRSLNYHDPGLTTFFMVWAISFVSIILYLCSENRSVMMLGYLAVMPYGVFRLTWRGFLGVALFTMAAGRSGSFTRRRIFYQFAGVQLSWSGGGVAARSLPP